MGFSSIIDILGSTIIGGMLILILLTLNSSATKNQYFFSGEVRTQTAMLSTTEIMEYDLYRIGYLQDFIAKANQNSNPTSNPLILDASSNSLSFNTDLPKSASDIEGDGIQDRITYYTGSVPVGTYPNDSLIYLYRRINNDVPQLMPVGLVFIEFKYYDADGAIITSPNMNLTRINTIEISLKFEDPYPYDYAESKVSGTNRSNVVATSYWRHIKVAVQI